ncbi:MAG: hypothetical protein J6T90_01365 [Methanomicrobium sp.]|nr:hypothetical protein [Methanomicrobium sp.]
MAEDELMAAFFLSELHQKYEENVTELKHIREIVEGIKEDASKLKGLSGTGLDEAADGLEATAGSVAQRIKDVEAFLDFYLKDKNSVGVVLLERDAYMKINQILRWNKADVRELKRWINDLKEICVKLNRNPHDLMSFRRLPSIEMPEVAIKYPAWAMDKNGYCIVGPEYDEIMHIDEVMDAMEDGTNPFPVHPVSTHLA